METVNLHRSHAIPEKLPPFFTLLSPCESIQLHPEVPFRSCAINKVYKVKNT